MFFKFAESVRLTLYADDVVLFLRPDLGELALVKEILRVFGEASRLVTNIGKSPITPIQCDEQEVAAIQEALPCQVVEFPCKYLGLPLSPEKLPRREFLSLIDKETDRLPGWKAALIRPAGRVTLVKAVLTAIPI